MEYMWPNLPTMFFSEAQKRKSNPFLWSKKNGAYSCLTWDETLNQVCSLSSALIEEKVKHGDRIVLISENRPEWLIADMAIMSLGAITVPGYTTNTEEDNIHILEDSKAKGVIVSTQKLTEKVKTASTVVGKTKFIISMENFNPKETQETRFWDTIMMEHDSNKINNIQELAKSKNIDDTACIIYTSGTGGKPKGVMLSHRNLLHNIKGAQGVLNDLGLENNTFLSFLPLSHSYEHLAGQFVPISIGAQIYYAEGIDTLATNMMEANPTIMTAVPRLYDTMYQKIFQGIKKSGWLKKVMFNKTYELGKKLYEDKKSLTSYEQILNVILDKLVRDKIRSKFGGQLKAMVSGGAPLNPDVGIFFNALGIPILQGYGQTETAPLVSANLPSNARMDTVGPPVSGTEVKIASDGEILVRGDLVMQGYWNNAKATSEVIRNGWIHTGDIGVIKENGHLKITDRKKDIIVNSGGDNISPQRIEGLLTLKPEILQAAVFGDNQPYLVALIVPDTSSMKTGSKYSDTIIKEIIDQVNEHLSPIEKIKRFTIIHEPFSIENKQMTPTMKVRRHIVKNLYSVQLQKMSR